MSSQLVVNTTSGDLFSSWSRFLKEKEAKRLLEILSLRYRFEDNSVSLLRLKQLYHHLLHGCSQSPLLLATLQLMQHITRTGPIPRVAVTEALCSYLLILLQTETGLLRSCVDTATEVLIELIHLMSCLCQTSKGIIWLMSLEWICVLMLQKQLINYLMLIMWIGQSSLKVMIGNLLLIITLTCPQLSLWIECGSLSLLQYMFQSEDPQILKFSLLTLSVCLRRWPLQEDLFRRVLSKRRIQEACKCIHYCDPLCTMTK